LQGPPMLVITVTAPHLCALAISAHTVSARSCEFMLDATRTAAASSAERIGPSPVCHPSVASATGFATSRPRREMATRVTVERSVCTRRSSIVRLDEPWRNLASRFQAVAAFTASNVPLSASTSARMLFGIASCHDSLVELYGKGSATAICASKWALIARIRGG
jgi:hypothetical protein